MEEAPFILQPIDIPPTDKFVSGWPWTEQVRPIQYDRSRNWPRISIITPSYNQGRFIEQTIRSVLLQNYPNLEYIIIDGGSKDETVDVIKKYEPWLSYWTSERDRGQSDALQKGFSRATGDIMAWINSDDFYARGALLKVAEAYMQRPFSLFCGSCRMITENNKAIQQLFTPRITFQTLLRYWKPHFCPPQPSIFFTGEVFEYAGPFDEELSYAMDFSFWLKAVARYQFTITEEMLSFYRVHSNSKTGSGNGFEKFIPEWKRVIWQNLRTKSLQTKLRFVAEEQAFHTKKRAKKAMQYLKDRLG